MCTPVSLVCDLNDMIWTVQLAKLQEDLAMALATPVMTTTHVGLFYLL
jgi:hypothetical protein